MNRQIFIVLGNNAALLLALGILYDTLTSFGLFSPKKHNIRLLQLLSGLMIGIIGVLLMLSPLEPSPGVNLDTRSILLSVSGLFFGFPSTLIAVFITSLFRIYLGGIGIWPGVAIIVTSAATGLIWRQLIHKKLSSLKVSELYLFGIATHLVMLLCIIPLPSSVFSKIFTDISLPIMIIFPAGTVLLSKIMLHRLKRSEMENELKESESRYKRLFENHHQIMILIDPDNGKIIAANPAACNFYGWSRKILEKMSVFQLHTLSSDPNLKKILSDHYEQHTSFIFQHRRVDDSIRDVEIYSSPIQIKGRTLLYFLIHDITTRKQMEKALMAEKERLAVTLRSIADGVITTDIQGRIVMMNRVAEKMTGWTQEEALGKPLSEVFYIINEYTRQICQNPVEKVLKTQSIVETENHTLLISRTKHERIISDSGAPIHDTAHCMIGVVLVFRDITEKQKMLETMQRAEKLDSLGVLAGGIAHDFNNLLSAIFGYIDMARIQSGTDKTLGDYLDRALEANSRARDLTQQLLTFAKGGTLQRSMIPLEPFLKKNVRFALSGSRVTYLFDIADQLDACEFDEHQMAQVIDNIVINAQQAMPYGGTIFVSAGNMEFNADSSSKGHQGRYCHISIRDNGPGIAKNLQKRIFDPFFSTKAKGSGLGLAICYSIIHQHDGFIEVQSEPGKGTTFHIYLPVSDKQGPEITTVRASVPPVRHEGRGNILIMDDEDAIRDILSTMLTIMGYTATKVADGREALKILQEKDKQGERFDAAILDLTVPGGVGGMEAVTNIRKTHPDLPVFASSGYSEDPVMSQPSAYGFTDSLRKPYTTTELADLLNRHLTGKEDSIEHCLQM